MAKGAKPKGLAAYIRWFADRWSAEMPTEMHGMTVWIGRPAENIPPELVGGSHLGSPNLRDPFRRLMENSPFEVEYAEYDGHVQLDPHYVRPVHAAIARVAHRRPIIARWLAALAHCGFDWKGLGTRRGWSDEETELFLEAALYILWRSFDEAPREQGGWAA